MSSQDRRRRRQIVGITLDDVHDVSRSELPVSFSVSDLNEYAVLDESIDGIARDGNVIPMYSAVVGMVRYGCPNRKL
jgi:hypothetical protein